MMTLFVASQSGWKIRQKIRQNLHTYRINRFHDENGQPEKELGSFMYSEGCA